jgi:acetyltransferase-like isoleucine patch superfamily enzyme
MANQQGAIASSTDLNKTKRRKTQQSVTKGGSVLSRYQNVIIGNRSVFYGLYYEICIWMAHIPGALGLALRKIFYPRLFGACGKGVAFGEGIILRHPKRIFLGDRVVLSERCTLDARTYNSDEVIVIGDDVILSNDAVLSCKEGTIRIGSRTGIGAQTMIHSRVGCPVELGEDVLIGPRCFITGGGSYRIDRIDIPINQQEKVVDGGVTLENDVWLGANVTALGGVTLGTGCVAAAGAVITKSMPPRAICMGVPAKVTKMREDLVKSSESLTN